MGSNSSKNGGTGASYTGSGANSEAGTQAGSESSSTVDSAGYAVGSSPGSVGVESVGVVGTDQLIAEAEAAAAGIPNADPAAGQPADLNPNGQWSALTPPAAKVLSIVVFPAWKIPDAERDEFAAASAECLEQVFPGGIEGKYACWVRVLVTAGAITVGAVARNGGKLPPLFVESTKSTPKPNGAAGPAHDPMTLTSLTP